MFVNLTSHDVVLHHKGARWVFKRSGTVARVSVENKLMGEYQGVPLYMMETGSVVGLPERRKGVYYIVSGIIVAALPYRKDLLQPIDLIRNKSGRVVGCRGLGRPSES